MNRSLGRRVASAAGAVAMAGGIIAVSSGAAHAAVPQIITMDTSHGVGIYNGASDTSGKPGFADLEPGDKALVTCYRVGQDIENGGDVWYGVTEVWHNGKPDNLWGTYFIYAAYADGNAYFDANRSSLKTC